MLYRAISGHRRMEGQDLRMSSIGHAVSKDGAYFEKQGLLLKPGAPWDRFGCEDPRATVIDGKIYVFYTAIGAYPFVPDHIRIGLAIFEDLTKAPVRHLVTPFNAKAMCLFPEKIDGKYVAMLSVNTDQPPSNICIAEFDRLEQMWSRDYWRDWHCDLPSHALPLKRLNTDQIEVGAPPIRVPSGWLMIYCRIQNYGHSKTLFGIEAAILDAKDPKKVLARSRVPFLTPTESYEIHGTVPNVVFPSGATLVNDELRVYYGGADTVCAVATGHWPTLLESLVPELADPPLVVRSPKNPILTSRWEHPWERMGVYNPGCWQDGNILNVVYRGQDNSGTSFFGLATYSADEMKFLGRDPDPIYSPRAYFEQKAHLEGNSGCEDPRLTMIDDTIYMFYTAYRGDSPPRVALTTISKENFENKKWETWSEPLLISPPGMADKDACFFPEKIKGKYVTIHRIEPDIVFDYRTSIDFDGVSGWLESQDSIAPRAGSWEGIKIGANAPPIKTADGWLLLYHGVGANDRHYRLGALLLDLENPAKILGRTFDPILEPIEGYERFGQVRNVVFPCGVGQWKDNLFIFYGGADSCTCLATVSISKLILQLKADGDVR